MINDTNTPDHPTTATSPDTSTTRTVLAAIGRRWPTLLALAMSVPGLVAGGSTSITGFGQVLALLPLVYLILAKLRRVSWTWPIVIVGSAVTVGLGALDLVHPQFVLTGIALVVLLWAAVDGDLRRSGTLRWQAIGTAIFCGLALAALFVDPTLARYLVAAGWFLHGVWDFVHLKLGKPVARSFAEWCGVIDIFVAIELVILD